MDNKFDLKTLLTRNKELQAEIAVLKTLREANDKLFMDNAKLQAENNMLKKKLGEVPIDKVVKSTPSNHDWFL